VIYRDDVQDITTGKKPRGDFFTNQLSTDQSRQEAKNLYDASSSPQQQPINEEDETYFKPVLLLVALRLGIDSLHPTYYPALKACFELPSFVGIAGGRPNSSLYFIGLQGDELIYLDPHFSRPALETKHLNSYTKEELNTYHCTVPRRIHISHLDPSMLLGFYCRTQQDFDLLNDQIKAVKKETREWTGSILIYFILDISKAHCYIYN
jgi:cysteine protease ATG4